MNNLTSKQKQIITDITEQFQTINASVKPSTSFSLIDISEFNEAKRQGDIRTAEINAQNQALRSAVRDEMTTIAEALNSDFKGTKLRAEVKEYGQSSELIIVAGLLYYSQHEPYEIQIKAVWIKQDERINDAWVDALVSNKYEIAYWDKEVHTTIADLVKSESFKKLLSRIYLKTIKSI
jgi:hypothetical protein